MHTSKWLRLQLFGEGGDGAATGADGSAAGSNAGSNASPAADGNVSFDEFLKKNPAYKAAHGAKVRDAVTQRVNKLNDRIGQYAVVTDILAARYGMDMDDDGNYDLTALADRVRSDRAGLSEAAMEDGISPETKDRNLEYDFKVKRDQAKARGSAKREQEQARAMEIGQQVQGMMAKYPDFDMDREMQNPTFADHVFKRGNSVEDAYFLVHKDEMLKGVAAYTAQQTQVAAAAHIAAGHGRPNEGAAGGGNAASAAADPRKMTKEEREATRKAVYAGKKVYW